MNTKSALSLLAAATLALSSATFAAGPKDDYQVTGPVAEVNDSMIVVEKGAKKERFEIARDSSTKMSGDVKVGDKVTVMYSMKATSVEAKAGKTDKKAKDAPLKAAASPAASPKK
jgi:ribosomal 50S subunit-recycling heat shock protein